MGFGAKCGRKSAKQTYKLRSEILDFLGCGIPGRPHPAVPGVWRPRKAGGVMSPGGRDVRQAVSLWRAVSLALRHAAQSSRTRHGAAGQACLRVCEIKAAGLYKFIGIWEASILGWVSKARTAQSATVPQHGGRVGRLSCANPAPEGPCTANLRYIK